MNDLMAAKQTKEELWEQIETATTWESIYSLSKDIEYWSSEVRRLRAKYDLI